jgi:spermidine/putrescine transport system ATP-binding protein
MKLVHLSGFEQRRPQQLSGGQQQRVALARSLVLRPAVLLLDEPLGALDAKIRKTLRVELQTLQRQVGITFVFVTHDQEEALTMSDRMAVMNGGRIEQVGAPRDVYEYPETEFVADFLGVSNRMEVEVCDVQDRTCVLRIGNERVVAAFDPSFDTPNGRVQIVVRPEQVKVTSNPNRSDAPLGAVSGRVERVTYAGSVLQVSIRIATGSLIEAAIPNTGDAEQLEQGTLVIVHLPSNAVRVLCAAPSDLA